MAVMGGIIIANQRSTTAALLDANQKNTAITAATQRNLRNAEVAAAMGMITQLTSRWRNDQNDMLELQSELVPQRVVTLQRLRHSGNLFNQRRLQQVPFWQFIRDFAGGHDRRCSFVRQDDTAHSTSGRQLAVVCRR